MQALAAVVFERTLEGAAKINSVSDTLPRALRSVLLAVDGRSSVARYEPFLTSLMPLDEKFAALEQLGLLRRKGISIGLSIPTLEPLTAEAAVTEIATTGPGFDLQPDFEPELQALSRQMGLIPDNPAPTAGSVPSPEGWGDLADFASQANKAASAVDATACAQLPAATRALTELETLRSEMEVFLSQAVGLDGLPVVIMVAQINSLEQLRLELPSYKELVRSYGLGLPAETHINSLETQLARYGS